MDELREEVKKHFEKGSHIGHGFDHVERVAKLIAYIAEKENYNVEKAVITAYLHDIGRTVQDTEQDHGPAGVNLARELLDKYTDYDEYTKQEIIKAVHDHSFLQPEGELTGILQDADMLDGLGAIGIMRVYSYKSNLPCYDEDNIVPTEGKRNSTMNEAIAFHMRWLGFMHTKTAKRIAEKRHRRMQKFLEDFKEEALRLDLD